MQNNIYIAVYVAATFYTLFMDEIRVLALPMSADNAIFAFMFITFLLFFVEIFLLIFIHWNDKRYIWRTFFWLDIISVLSIIIDIPWMRDAIIGNDEANDHLDQYSVMRASRATRFGSRAGKLSHLMTLTNVMRVLRVLRLMKAAKETNDEEHAYTRRAKVPRRLAKEVVEQVSRRVAGVVLMVVVVVFLCVSPLQQSENKLEGLNLLENLHPNLTAGDVASISFNSSLELYTTAQPQLLYLEIAGVQYFPPVEFVQSQCAGGSLGGSDELQGPRLNPCFRDPKTMGATTASRFRQLELREWNTANDMSVMYLDGRDLLRQQAALSMLLILLIVAMLIGSAFIFAKDCMATIAAPVEDIVMAKQTTEALLDVFKIVADENDVNSAFCTIVGALCKVLEADRVSIYFVDTVHEQLICRHSLQLRDVLPDAFSAAKKRRQHSYRNSIALSKSKSAPGSRPNGSPNGFNAGSINGRSPDTGTGSAGRSEGQSSSPNEGSGVPAWQHVVEQRARLSTSGGVPPNWGTGDRVKICKIGNHRGEEGTIDVPDWTGRVKIKMDKGGEIKSYMANELINLSKVRYCCCCCCCCCCCWWWWWCISMRAHTDCTPFFWN
jgi:hypothetical protein